MNEILKDKEWKDRFYRRGTRFFMFLNEWAKYVKTVVITTGTVPWQGDAIFIKNPI